MSELTKSEQAIADLLPDGLANKEICRKLNMPEGTVKIHLKSMMRKLGVKNRTQAAILIDRQSRSGIRANWAFGAKRQQS